MDISNKLTEYRNKKIKNGILKNKVEETKEKLLDDSSLLDDAEDIKEIDDSLNCLTFTDVIYYSLCLIFWVILFVIFIKLQFGTIFFIVSSLVGIYINTRTSPKRKGEISAYSVFNKNCESIDGTLKAEQFEREIRYGPSIMK